MHRVHDPKCILAFFIVVGGGLCLAIRLDQRGPGPHCEAGHACSHASSAQEPCGGGFHLKSGFATFRSSGEIIFSFASLIPYTLKDGKVIFPGFQISSSLWASRNPASRSFARSFGGGGNSTTPILFMLGIVMFVPCIDIVLHQRTIVANCKTIFLLLNSFYIFSHEMK